MIRQTAHRIWNSGIATVILVVLLILNLALMAGSLTFFNLPGNYEGFAPVQPVQFSHRLHSGELLISCVYCHPGAETERFAGVISPSLCLNCHRFVQATLGAVREEERLAREEGRDVRPVVSSEIQKIYDALGLDLGQKRVGPGEPIRWIRVHHLPDFAVFHHGIHAAAGNECSECHGEVQKMERVRQTATLTMGWCVDCHRKYTSRTTVERVLNPSMDCGACHY